MGHKLSALLVPLYTDSVGHVPFSSFIDVHSLFAIIEVEKEEETGF